MGELEEGGAGVEEVGGGLSDEEPADGLGVDLGGRVEDVEEEADAGDVAGFGETGEGVGAGGMIAPGLLNTPEPTKFCLRSSIPLLS